MLGAVVGDVSDWLISRLFDPLGIDNPQWHRCPLGWFVGGSGLESRMGELARIRRVLRDRGRWDDNELIDPTWIDRMHDPSVETGGEEPFERFGLRSGRAPVNAGGWTAEGPTDNDFGWSRQVPPD